MYLKGQIKQRSIFTCKQFKPFLLEVEMTVWSPSGYFILFNQFLVSLEKNRQTNGNETDGTDFIQVNANNKSAKKKSKIKTNKFAKHFSFTNPKYEKTKWHEEKTCPGSSVRPAGRFVLLGFGLRQESNQQLSRTDRNPNRFRNMAAKTPAFI